MSQHNKSIMSDEAQKKSDYGLPIALGLCFGTAIGVAMDNPVYGMGFGLNTGLLVGAISARQCRSRSANIAIAISLFTLFCILVSWFFRG